MSEDRQWGEAPAPMASLPWKLALAFVAGTLIASAVWIVAEHRDQLPSGDASRQPATANAVPPTVAGLQQLLASRDTFARDRAALELAGRSSVAEIEALMRALGNRTGPAADALRATLLTRLASADPTRALALIADLQPELAGRTAEFVAIVFDVWGRRNMNAAIADWRLLEGMDRNLAAEALLHIVLERNGDTEEFLRALPQPAPVARLRVVIAREMAMRDPAGAWQRAYEQHDIDGLHVVARQWGRRDPIDALEASERIPATSLREGLRSNVMSDWLRRDPFAALDTLLQHPGFAEAPLQGYAFDLGATVGAQGVDAVLERIPADRRTNVLEFLVDGVAENDPEAGWQLTRRLRFTDEAQGRVRSRILLRVAATSPERAIALTNSLSDTQERDRHMQMLSEDFIDHDRATALQFIMEIDDLSLRATLRDALAARASAAPQRAAP